MALIVLVDEIPKIKAIDGKIVLGVFRFEETRLIL